MCNNSVLEQRAYQGAVVSQDCRTLGQSQTAVNVVCCLLLGFVHTHHPDFHNLFFHLICNARLP